MSKPKVIAIVGPTAAGKTSLSINIAKTFNGEVISADSRQIYRGMDIGTGKVTMEEMAGIPHHLLNIVDPMQVYTAAEFVHDATDAIDSILTHEHLPVIAGGTFFYIQLLRGQMQAAPVEPNEALRAELEQLSTEKLFEKLAAADPRRAATIDKDNRRRLIRSLEIIEELGTVPEVTLSDSLYDWLILGVNIGKEQLLQNFAKRLDGWLEAGFVAEVERLLAEGVTRERFQELGFEYSLMLDYIDKKISLPELKERFVQKNWQYAKRQMTWLKRDPEIVWVKSGDLNETSYLVDEFLHK